MHEQEGPAKDTKYWKMWEEGEESMSPWCPELVDARRMLRRAELGFCLCAKAPPALLLRRDFGVEESIVVH